MDEKEELKENVTEEIKMVVGADIVLYQEAETGLTEESRDRIKKSYPELIETVLEAGEHYRSDVLGKEINKDICKAAHKLKVKLEKAVKSSNTERLQSNREKKDSIDNGNEDFKLLRAIIDPILSTLDDTANHYKALEEKKISDRRIERLNKLLELDEEAEEPAGLKTWSDEDFDIYLSGKEIQINEAIKQALILKKENEEKDRLVKLKEERILESSDYSDYIPEYKTLDFSVMTQVEYFDILSTAKNAFISVAWVEAHKESKERSKEQLLTDKANGFIETLLEDGYKKRTRGDYIKGKYTVSVDTLKTLSKREFTDRIKEVNNSILLKDNSDWVEAHSMHKTWTEEKAASDKLAAEKKLSKASDSVKMIKFSQDALDYFAKYQIELKDQGNKEYINEVISRITKELRAVKVVADR